MYGLNDKKVFDFFLFFIFVWKLLMRFTKYTNFQEYSAYNFGKKWLWHTDGLIDRHDEQGSFLYYLLRNPKNYEIRKRNANIITQTNVCQWWWPNPRPLSDKGTLSNAPSGQPGHVQFCNVNRLSVASSHDTSSTRVFL